MAKRFFVFGCSFTKWHTPTWADLMRVAVQPQGYEFYNFGLPGMGNKYIFFSMMLADATYNFSEEDIIIVIWTGWHREDRLRVEDNIVKWTRGGNIFSTGWYDDDFLKTHWSLENDIVNNMMHIRSAQKLFNLRFEGSILPEQKKHDIENDWTKSLAEDFISFNFKNPWPEYQNYGSNSPVINVHESYKLSDGHPYVYDHLHYLKHVIAPAFPDIEVCNHHSAKLAELTNTIITDEFSPYIKNEPKLTMNVLEEIVTGGLSEIYWSTISKNVLKRISEYYPYIDEENLWFQPGQDREQRIKELFNLFKPFL